MTVCNTGSLATAGYGTALGVVRALHEQHKLDQVFACETRPYNQVPFSKCFKMPGQIMLGAAERDKGSARATALPFHFLQPCVGIPFLAFEWELILFYFIFSRCGGYAFWPHLFC